MVSTAALRGRGRGSGRRSGRPPRSGWRLATITSDPPDAERGIEISQVYVAPDGPRLAQLGQLLAAGTIGVAVSTPFPLEHAARALAYLQQGTNGQAVVIQPGPTRS
jgi:NADPH:quinone reductase-like Zn-dependent oxidoreductase